MRAWPAVPTSPRWRVRGPPRAPVHDTARGEPWPASTPSPGRHGPAVRLRHHAVRRDPPRPRRDVRRLRPAQPGLARRRPRGHATSRTSPTSTTRCSSGPTATARTGRAGRARDRAVPRGHGGAAGAAARRTTSAPSSRSRWSIELVERLADAGRGRTTSTATSTSRCTPTRPSARSRAGPREQMLRGLRRARRRPRPPRQEGPAGLPAVARPRARRAGLGRRRAAAAGPAGTSSAPPSRCTTSAPPSTCRAAAATWSSRTTR